MESTINNYNRAQIKDLNTDEIPRNGDMKKEYPEVGGTKEENPKNGDKKNIKLTNVDLKEDRPANGDMKEVSPKNGGITISVDSQDGDKSGNGPQEFSDKNCGNFLGVQRAGHRMSIMEQESLKERFRVSLLKQCSSILNQGDQRYTKDTLHKTFQDDDLLERIFRLFDVEKLDHLVQEDWIEYLKERLTEERQLDFVEQVESVAYVLCGHGAISLDNFQKIFRSKVVTDRLFRVVDPSSDGHTTADAIMEFLATISSSRPRAGFDKASVDRLEQLFRQTVGDQKEITQEQFKKIMVSKNPFFTDRVFQIFDEDNSGSISLQEFLAAAQQDPEEKMKFLFKVYDIDGDGLIQHRELRHVMRACMEENGMQFSEDQLLDLTSAMLEDADAEERGAITYEALRHQLQKHGGLLENLTISIDRWLIPPKPEVESKNFFQKLRRWKPHQFSKKYIKNNYVFVGYLVVFVLVNFGLFVSRAIEYRESNGFVIIARACGQCLNFTCAWVLVLMLRHVITWARARGAGAVFPLDHHVYLHKLTGVLISVYSVVHTVMHACNFSLIVVNDPVVNANNYTVTEWLLTEKPGLFGLVPGCANPTGVALAFSLVLMVFCSRPGVRREGSFEVFYWSHLLYVPFWLLLLFHGPNFWKWFIAPGLVYLAERIMRLAWMRSERGKTYISSGILLPSRVTHLVVRRPPQFEFHAGDYVFLNVPAIARAEWHPFTISSAPEQQDHIWFHIRGVGEWTNRLYKYFEGEQAKLHAGEIPAITDCGHEKSNRTTSSHSPKSIKSKRSVDFSPSPTVYDNEGFTLDEEKPNGDTQSLSKITEKKSNLLTVPLKMPLEKSLSMPDMQNRVKKKQRLIALRDYMRSESESSFDECSLRRSRLRALGLAYRSPQHKELAHSFRYMRTKPTIIAFKTPSMDVCEKSSLITAARRRLSKTISPDKDVESAKSNFFLQNDANGSTMDSDAFANFPVGKPLEIYIDGPYGAPSSHIFRAQHAALIAAGIGVTPFASILQCIMHRYWNTRNVCPRCQHTWASDAMQNMNLRKVDFFWLNREQRSFEWFVSLLSQLEIEQAELGGAMERFLEMHMYITSALQRSDMKAVGLQLALDLLHEKGKRDLITGLKTRTNAGRPNWDKVFQQLQQQNKGKVTVFYCGPPQLARILRVKCDQFGFEFRKEVF